MSTVSYSTHSTDCGSTGIRIIFDPLRADRYQLHHLSFATCPGLSANWQELATQLIFKFDAQGRLFIDISTGVKDPSVPSGWLGVPPLFTAYEAVRDVEASPGVLKALSSPRVEDWRVTKGLAESAIRAKLSLDSHRLSDDIATSMVNYPNCTLLSGKDQPVAILSDTSITPKDNPSFKVTATTTWSSEGIWARDVHVTWAPEELLGTDRHAELLEKARRWIKLSQPDLQFEAEDGPGLRKLLIQHQADEHESFERYIGGAERNITEH